MTARASEATRAAVLAAFVHPIWCDASDEELASEHRTSPAVVRDLRAEHRRNLDLARIVDRADDLARRIAWQGTTAELVLWCVETAHRRAEANGFRHPDEHMQALRDALRAARETDALEAMEAPHHAA